MNMYKKLMLLGAALAPAAVITAVPASAQVSGIATVNPAAAIASTKAYGTASQQIETTYKASLDQIDAKQKTRQGLLAQIDKNGDKQVSQEELEAAQKAKLPAYTQLEQIDREIDTLSRPAVMAQAYALEQLAQRYDAAQQKVVTDRKISMILTPDSFMYISPAVNVTDAVTAALDASTPTVSITPPANWRPQRGTLQLQQQVQQLQQIAALRAAQAARQQTGAAPAAGAQQQSR